MSSKELDKMIEDAELYVSTGQQVGNKALDNFSRSLVKKLVRLATEHQADMDGKGPACGSLYDLLVTRLGVERVQAVRFVENLHRLDIHQSVTSQLSTYLPRL